MSFITLESRFEVPQNFMNAHTRNKCSEDLVLIIEEIASIIYPGQEFEIYVLPPEPGSYKDLVKILNKNSGAITAVAAIGALSFTFLTYIDAHQDHKNSEKNIVLDETTKCLALKTQIEELKNKGYEVENIPEEKIQDICGNLRLKKLKNDRYRKLENDQLIAAEETSLKNEKSEIIFNKRISKNEFPQCKEIIPENEGYSLENVKGVIELISLVVKQKKEGRGIAWKGVFYGENIKYRGVSIIDNGEEISFFMQDPDFKNQIEKHEVIFSSGDNIRVIFDIKGEVSGPEVKTKNIYIKEVQKFNEDVIEHPIKASKNRNIPKNQQKLIQI